jgi:hypothetical protein
VTTVGEIPAEWRIVPTHVRWPDTDLRRRYDGAEVVLDGPDGAADFRPSGIVTAPPAAGQ